MESEYELSHVTDRLSRRGYEDMFRAEDGGLRSEKTGRLFAPEDLEVDEVARFEGPSNPDDEAVVFALRAREAEVRGTYVVPFGPAMPFADSDMVARLRTGERPARPA